MSAAVNYEDSRGWLSRIAQSAGSLTQDLLSVNSAHEATNDLDALRSAHKTGYEDRNGERRQKFLSSRHRANGAMRNSKQFTDYVNDAELEEEIVDFLRRQCSIAGDGASSSRSVSPLSGWNGDDENRMSTDTGTISWTKSRESLAEQASYFERMESVASQSNGGLFSGTANYSKEAEESQSRMQLSPINRDTFYEDFPTAAVRQQVAAALASREAAHFDTHSATPAEVSTVMDVELPSLNQQAARRLQLISSHLAANAVLQDSSILDSALESSTSQDVPTSVTREPAFESAYNQLCHGEMDQAWEGFQSDGPYCLAHDVQQQHVDGCQQVSQTHTSFSHHQPQALGMQPDIKAYQTLDRMGGQATQTPAKPSLETKDEDPDVLSHFHCPWVGCRKHLENGYQYLRNSSGELEGLGCVHEGCDDVYTEEAEWRDHVMSAHHGIMQTPRYEVSERNEDVFEKAWNGNQRSE